MVNSIDDPLKNPQAVADIVSINNSDNSVGAPKSSDKGSTLTPSESKALEKQREMAGAPVLPPPQQQLPEYNLFNNLLTINIEGKMMTPLETKALIDNMMASATIKMLSSWCDSLHELQQYQDQKHAIEKVKERVQESIRTGEQRSEQNKETNKEEDDKFVTQGLLVSAGILAIGAGQGISAASLPSFVTMKAIGQVVSAVTPTALDSAISSLVSLCGAGLVTQAGVLTLKSGPQDKKTYDYEFAKNYATRTLDIVNGKEIDTAVKNVAGNDADLAAKKATLAKIALLGQTLAFSYRLETGSLTGDELAGMMKGDIKFAKDDFRNPVIDALKFQINQLPTSDRATVVEKLMAYYDAKPTLSELVEPAKAIRSLFGNKITAPPMLAG